MAFVFRYKVRKKAFNQSLKTSKVISFPSKTTYFKVLYRITTERSSFINPPAQKLIRYHHPYDAVSDKL